MKLQYEVTIPDINNLPVWVSLCVFDKEQDAIKWVKENISSHPLHLKAFIQEIKLDD